MAIGIKITPKGWTTVVAGRTLFFRDPDHRYPNWVAKLTKYKNYYIGEPFDGIYPVMAVPFCKIPEGYLEKLAKQPTIYDWALAVMKTFIWNYYRDLAHDRDDKRHVTKIANEFKNKLEEYGIVNLYNYLAEEYEDKEKLDFSGFIYAQDNTPFNRKYLEEKRLLDASLIRHYNH